jgi:hypothetical protein
MKLIEYFQSYSETKKMAWKIFFIFILISLASCQKEKCPKKWQRWHPILQSCVEKNPLDADCTENDDCVSLFCINTNNSVNKVCKCEPSNYT